MRTTERHARNDHIVQLRLRGYTMKQIAAEVGVSERHCARILDERKQATRSSTSLSEGKSLSSASTTEVLDRLQTTVGSLAATAELKAGPNDVGAIIRVGLERHFAEQDIAELRRRSEQLAPIDDVTTGGGSPPSKADMS